LMFYLLFWNGYSTVQSSVRSFDQRNVVFLRFRLFDLPYSHSFIHSFSILFVVLVVVVVLLFNVPGFSSVFIHLLLFLYFRNSDSLVIRRGQSSRDPSPIRLSVLHPAPCVFLFSFSFLFPSFSCFSNSCFSSTWWSERE